MTVLFESHPYPAERLDGLIDARYLQPLSAGRVRLNHVGYLYEKPQAQATIILPKVFLSGGQALGGHTPEDLLTLNDADSPLRERLRQEGKTDFLFRFSVWLYRAIRQFQQRHRASVLPERSELLAVSAPGKTGLSELEIIQSLVRFHQENGALFTFIRRFNTSQQHKVSWSRTVSRQQPLLQNGRPVYTEPVVKQKHVDYDEELLVLYFSTLADLRQRYGFRLDLNPLYTLLPAREFARFQRQATRRLKAIRNRYFSDKLLHVWHLLYLYYERQETMKSEKPFREVLLVRDFNVVFEDMIDHLLSDPKEAISPRLKDQPDGKIVDHIYPHESLLAPDWIYHLGDSKYYKPENDVGADSVFKQYTYARNALQLNIDLLNAGTLPPPLRYRDEVTEGYNPTPNFFISAVVGDTLDFRHDGLELRKTYPLNRHFPDRLFDRDTLLLQGYDINFLYVLAAYVAGNPTDRNRFRQQARSEFRNRLVGYLRGHFVFFKITPPPGTLEEFVTRQFRLLTGRMYRPSDFGGAVLVAVALPNLLDWERTELPLLQMEATVETWEIQ